MDGYEFYQHITPIINYNVREQYSLEGFYNMMDGDERLIHVRMIKFNMDSLIQRIKFTFGLSDIESKQTIEIMTTYRAFDDFYINDEIYIEEILDPMTQLLGVDKATSLLTMFFHEVKATLDVSVNGLIMPVGWIGNVMYISDDVHTDMVV